MLACFVQRLICFLYSLWGEFTFLDLILVTALAGGSSDTVAQHRHPEEGCAGAAWSPRLSLAAVCSVLTQGFSGFNLQWEQP